MTYVTDPIGDLLTRIRNAQSVGHTTCSAPFSRVKMGLLETLKRDGWISDFKKIGENPKFDLEVTFSPEKPKLELKRISRPGRRMYKNCDALKPVLNGFGIAILSTSQGIMTDKEARGKNIGGEVLCTIS